MKATLSFFASICALACSVHAEQSSPWEKMPVYIVNDGHLYSVDALSPDLPGYVGYSIYYDQAGQAAGVTGDDWREAFAKGYYAYRKTNDSLKPFERVTLPSPPDIVRQVQALPRFTTEKDYTNEPPPRCLMLPSDTYATYWRRIDETLGMADSLGRVFFFPGNAGQERLIPWKENSLIPLRDVTPRPNSEGWLAVRYTGTGKENILAWLHPVTGEFRPSAARPNDENEHLSVDLVRSAWLNADTVVTHSVRRWCDHLEVVRISTGENLLSNRLRGMGYDILVVDNQAWAVNGRGFCAQLYPAPQFNPQAPLRISLQHEDNPDESVMNLKVTVSNQGADPITLPKGWGSFVYRFAASDEDMAKRALVEPDEAEGVPAVTLKPGETASFLRQYKVSDYRIFPRRTAQVKVMVSLTPDIDSKSPGAEVATSTPIIIPTPIP
ncbi:hypothetical protein ICN84_03945 [Akkermansia glycaniphila]|uniref:hypothetical protein n=1 Tax=Akkermansia glycaniphila TaxID=1679444 RepID=UPI001C02A3B5|nr:hypothetical protein [Akkermansia glycaniphila]MBT9449226.1 hypothetical protein [Akkermansia glycaniphila]